jgi:cation transporter-like permease
MDDTFSQVQSVGSSQFEAVDLSAIMQRAGFDPDSAAVPAP